MNEESVELNLRPVLIVIGCLYALTLVLAFLIILPAFGWLQFIGIGVSVSIIFYHFLWRIRLGIKEKWTISTKPKPSEIMELYRKLVGKPSKFFKVFALSLFILLATAIIPNVI